jgi:membrane protein DedA with SNARE-associated domain
MNYWMFSLYTCVGAALWVSILTYAGYMMGKNQEMIKVFMKHASWYVIGFVVLILAAHMIKQRICPPQISEE